MKVFSFVVIILLAVDSHCNEEDSRRALFTSSSDFLTVTSLSLFIDKTLLIKEVLDGPQYILVTAPRRFGKSTNLSMLKYFLSISSNQTEKENRLNTFQKLIIYKTSPKFVNETFGSYPVLYVDLEGDEQILNFNDAIQILAKRTHNSYRMHPYLVSSESLNEKEKRLIKLWCGDYSYERMSVIQVKNGLKNLASYLYKHFNNRKIFLLVDQYESVITDAMFIVNKADLNDINKLFSSLISKLVKFNDHVVRAVVTGISYIAGYGLSRNLKVFKFLDAHPYAPFYGLAHYEIELLFNRFNVTTQESKFAHTWYNGYVCKMGNRIYNTYSLLNFLSERKVRSYWIKSERVNNLVLPFYAPGIESRILQMLRDESLKINHDSNSTLQRLVQVKRLFDYRDQRIDSVTNIFFLYLCELGYLTYDWNDRNYIRIPNKEVKALFIQKLRCFIAVSYKYKEDDLERCVDFFNKINTYAKSSDVSFKGEVERLQLALKRVTQSFIQMSPKEETTNESILEKVLYFILANLNDNHIDSQIYNKYTDENRNEAEGRLDLYLTRGMFSVNVDLKYSESSINALTRILGKPYSTLYNNTNDTSCNKENEIFMGISINKQGSVSISYLVNSRNISHALTLS